MFDFLSLTGKLDHVHDDSQKLSLLAGRSRGFAARSFFIGMRVVAAAAITAVGRSWFRLAGAHHVS
jgi:hypothetical protein